MVVFTWCIAHRLELAVKDSLSNEREFKEIDEMLLRLYYLYHKAPKKLCQLRELSHALAGAMEYHKGSVKPYKASGTRWITHKVKAMKIILMNWGVYIMHLENLTSDKSVPAGDRNKLKGYLKARSQSKIPFLLALFIDVLSVVSDLSLVFQSDSIDVFSFCDAISKAKRQMERLQECSFETMPFVKNLLSKIEKKEQKFFYMNIPIENYEKAKGNIAKKKTEILENVSNCLSKRLEEESDSETMFLHTPKILNFEGWADRGSGDIEFLDESSCFLFEHFLTPLKYAGMKVSYPEFISQWHNMLEYALKYIKLSGVSCLVPWKKLFTSPKKNEWSDALLLVELLFSVPVSSAKLERMISKLKRKKKSFKHH